MKPLTRFGLQIIIFLFGWLLFTAFYPSIAEEAAMSKTGNAEIGTTAGSQTVNNVKEICRATRPQSQLKPAPPSKLRIVSVRKSD